MELGTLGPVIADAPAGILARTVDSGGDVNGDGLDDVVIGSFSADVGGAADAGLVYVIFGRLSRDRIALADVESGVGGFVIAGADAGAQLGADVAMAGDVNGDGLTDVIASADNTALDGIGSAYVIFGKRDAAPVSVADIAAGLGGGFAIPGASAGDRLGSAVAGAGDVNGDGLADLIVTLSGARVGAQIVFGKRDVAPVDPSLILGGFPVSASLPFQGNIDVKGAGDVNGDGFDDVLLAQARSDVGTATGAGKVYVIFGRGANSTVDVADLDAGLAGGFVINGSAAGNNSGIGIAAAGDINADGLADILVGASGAASNGNSGAGKAYLVFGQAATTPVQLSNVEAGRGGFAMNGIGADDGTGNDVSNAGDMNADGVDDFLVGAPGATRDGVAFAGRVYVVFGKTDTDPVSFGTIVNDGRGGFTAEFRGLSTSGDFDGDGVRDLILADNEVIYVVLGP